jgi:hypothetical protein
MPGDFLTDDLDEFFDDAEFSTPATYTPVGGSASSISIIFDEGYLTINPDTGETEIVPPTAIAKSSVVPGVSHKATLTIASVAYEVTVFQTVKGITTMELKR